MTTPTRTVCTPDQLGSGVTVLSNTSNEIVRKKFLLPGRVGVLVLGPNCKPLANAHFTLSEGAAIIKSDVTSNKGLIELELPIDIYGLKVGAESFDVIAQEKGDKTVQVVQLQGTMAGIFDTHIPARPSGSLMGGREWLRWLGDPTTTKQVPFDGGKYDPLGVMKTMRVDVFDQENGELREHIALAEFRKGNMPAFCRMFKPVTLKHKDIGEATVYVTCDHLAIGSDDDYIRFPLGAFAAQILASEWNCHLPTFKIVVECFLAPSARQLVGHAMPLNKTVHQRANRAIMVHEDIIQGRYLCEKDKLDKEVFTPPLPFKTFGALHNRACQMPPGRHPGELVCGHKKEVIICHQQCTAAGRQGQGKYTGQGRLSMYGMWNEGGVAAPDAYGRKLPILWQGFNAGLFADHGANYADYSHGVRLVHPRVELKRKGSPTVTDIAYTAILADGKLRPLFTHLEGSDNDSNGAAWDRFGYAIPLPGTWQ